MVNSTEGNNIILRHDPLERGGVKSDFACDAVFGNGDPRRVDRIVRRSRRERRRYRIFTERATNSNNLTRTRPMSRAYNTYIIINYGRQNDISRSTGGVFTILNQ